MAKFIRYCSPNRRGGRRLTQHPHLAKRLSMRVPPDANPGVSIRRSLRGDLALGVRQRQEPVDVQALVTQAALNAPTKAFSVGLPGPLMTSVTPLSYVTGAHSICLLIVKRGAGLDACTAGVS